MQWISLMNVSHWGTLRLLKMEKYLYVELRESFECIDRFVVAYNEFEGYRAIVSNLWHIDGTAYIQIVIQIPFSQLLLLIKQIYSNEGDSFIQCQKLLFILTRKRIWSYSTSNFTDKERKWCGSFWRCSVFQGKTRVPDSPRYSSRFSGIRVSESNSTRLCEWQETGWNVPLSIKLSCHLSGTVFPLDHRFVEKGSPLSFRHMALSTH